MKAKVYSRFEVLFRLIPLLFLLVLLLSACKFTDGPTNETADEKKGNTIHYLLGDWPPDSLIFLAQEKGYFKENNVSVELIPAVGYGTVFEMKANPEVDYAWCYTLYEALIEKLTNSEPDLQILYVQDYSFGADAVMANKNSGIKTIADLKGKTVGVETGTVGEFFIGILLQREGLSLDDLNIVDVASEDVPAALASGEIEAAVAYQPAVATAVSQGAIIIADTTQERGVIADVCAARGEDINANKEDYKNYVKSIMQAVDFYNKNQDEAIEIMKKAFDMDPQELKEIFETLEIPDLRANKTAFNRSSGFNSLFSTAKQAEQFLLDQGVIEESASFEDIFDNNMPDLL